MRVHLTVGVAVAIWIGCSPQPSAVDGGEQDGCVPAGGCEKSLGVCAGRIHQCVNGAPEPICTSASYGTDYASEDILCDGLDNDCDGLVDVSAPTLLEPTTFVPYGHWRRWMLFTTDAGFVAFARDARPLVLDPQGQALAAPNWSAPVTFGPSGDQFAFRFGDGFRVLQNAGEVLYAIDFDQHGHPVRATDGGVAATEVARADGGGLVLGATALVLPSGDVFYDFGKRDSALPWRSLLIRSSTDAVVVPEVDFDHRGYLGFLRNEPSGAVGVVDFDNTELHYTRWSTSDLSALDGGAHIPVQLSAMQGWTNLDSEQVLLAQIGRDLVTWGPDSGTFRPFTTAAATGEVFREGSLADGDELLVTGIWFKHGTSDAGPEKLVAVFSDGGLKTLAEWTGLNSYYAPSSAIIDSQRALVVFGYPGPQDAGFYSLQFCR